MGTHNTTITVINNPTGVPPTRDGVMGLIMQGVSNASIAYDTPYLLTSLADATARGITPSYDVTNGTAVYQQISEFYQQAGDGALLWIMICAMNTTYATYIPSSAFYSYVQYTKQADPTMQAKIIGICYAPPVTTQSATDFPVDVSAAITAFQTRQVAMFQTGLCFSGIVDGYNMSSSVTPGTIGTQANNTAYAVSLCITGTKGNGVSAVGLALGKAARISVGHGWGATADGAIATPTAFLTNGILLTTASNLTTGNTYIVQGGDITYNGTVYHVGDEFTAVVGHATFTSTAGGYALYNSTPVGNIGGTITGMSSTDLDLLGGKQYLFIRTVENTQGLYWNDGATCVSEDNFFSSQEYNRVMNSLAYDARAFFNQYRGQNLPSDLQTGDLDASWSATKQKTFQKQYIDPLSAASGTGDISGGSITVNGPGYSGNGTLKFAITLVRATILGNIIGTMQFSLTLNT